MLLNRLLYAALFVVSFVFVYFYGGRMPFMLFYSLLLLPVISFSYTFLTYRRFKFGQEINKHIVTKGTKLEFQFFLENTSLFFFPFIKIRFFSSAATGNDAVEDTYSLLPGISEKHMVELPCRYRGRYDVGIDKIEVRDLLGLISFNRPIPEPHYVIVYPSVIPLSHFRTAEAHIEVETALGQNNRNSSNSVVSDIREYRYGDSMRKIHWKLSSKANRLMVKNYEGASEASVTVLIDLTPSLLDPSSSIIYEDKLIEAAVAVVNYCTGKNTGVKVVYHVDHKVETRIMGNYAFNLFLKDMAEVPFRARVSAAELLGSEARDIINKTDLIIVTGSLNEALSERIYHLEGAGFNVLPVYISATELISQQSNESEKIISGLSESGIKTYRIEISGDVKSVLEE